MTFSASDSSTMDRLDAAHALLGVSPNTVTGLDLDTRSAARVAKPISRSPSADSSCGLDALAAFAIQSMEAEGHSVVTAGNSASSTAVSSDDDDSETMPPPPPRFGRQRSCSNPEGMEKWDSYKSRQEERCRFVLPTSILEEELADAKCAVERKAEADRLLLQENRTPSFIDLSREDNEKSREAEVGPEELLRKARSRLLEDLSEGTITGPAGQLTLPHSLSKYKHVYNRNGRIGIYTPAERAAIISRYQTKRSRRVWNKKIRYNCRKNLADRRLRVKGRFVKREQIPALAHMKSMEEASLLPSSTPTATQLFVDPSDADMPDVNDPDAGFSPTEDQPFRRLRRHTIT